MASYEGGGAAGRNSSDTPAVDFTQFRARRLRMRLLDLLGHLADAMQRRDLQAVWDVLDEDDAVRWFPKGLREEAITFARLPAGSLRAPLRLYRYCHELQQLGDEPLEPTGDARQLTLDLPLPAPAHSALPFPDRPTAPPDDPRRGGGDHRRSGSR